MAIHGQPNASPGRRVPRSHRRGRHQLLEGREGRRLDRSLVGNVASARRDSPRAQGERRSIPNPQRATIPGTRRASSIPRSRITGRLQVASGDSSNARSRRDGPRLGHEPWFCGLPPPRNSEMVQISSGRYRNRLVPAVENLPDSAIRRPRRTREEFKAALEAAKLLPARPVSRPVWEQLHELATNPYCATAGATLKDRTFLPRVVFEHVDEAVKWRAPFWRRFVRPDLVVDVTRSPNQIPTPYVYRIW